VGGRVAITRRSICRVCVRIILLERSRLKQSKEKNTFEEILRRTLLVSIIASKEEEGTKKTTIIVYISTLTNSLENGPMHALKPPYFSVSRTNPFAIRNARYSSLVDMPTKRLLIMVRKSREKVDVPNPFQTWLVPSLNLAGSDGSILCTMSPSGSSVIGPTPIASIEMSSSVFDRRGL
jgi:hypothetical protein